MAHTPKDYAPIPCAVCGDEFKPGRGTQTLCGKVSCKQAAQRRRYAAFIERNPGHERERARKAHLNGTATDWPAKRANGLRVHEFKSTTPCMDCTNTFPAECMDFDHRPGEVKVNCVGIMVAHGWSWEKIETEIAKCDLVCSNCHRIRTRKRRLENGARRNAALAEDRSTE